jgi:hypothetical protein
MANGRTGFVESGVLFPARPFFYMQLTGHVTRKLFAAGSKSEREAVILVTDGGEFVLRRKGGNPFSDAALESLVGKRICCEGDLTGYTFLMTEWTEE